MSTLWGKVLSTLVIGVFSLVAIFLVGWLANLFYLHASAQHWVATPAKVIHWDIIQNQSTRKSRTEKLVASYQYLYDKQSYTGNQLDFSLAGDNFSGRRRAQQMEALRKEPLSIWVNPQSPGQSVLDRSLPVPQVSFVIFFLIFPCGLGTLFVWVYLLKGLTKITGLQTERYAMPLWGLLHGLPALYPLIFSFSELSAGPSVMLSLFSLLALYCLIEVIRRLLEPARGVPKIASLPAIAPIRRA